ncbi:MAG: cobalamin-dependent protein [Myxococcota bacterium]|jgi:methanogenic corrinoid protein MtbC1|nr:cobalamin-dependent protein [Myxococcota bacterium]
MTAEDDATRSLYEALLALNKEELLAQVDALIEASGTSRAQEAVDAIAAALQVVGQRFQDGEWFLNELVYSGEIAKEAMEKLSPLLAASGRQGNGLVIVGTVQGDLHDLGKDIFANYARSVGFDIVDLGVDVSVDEFTKAAQEYRPVAVGMSCLLTSCAGGVDRVIQGLAGAGMRDEVKIIVGGAALTEGFASDVGADAFAEDAVTGTNIVRKWAID